ncbi:MAG: hypothetical protein VX430_08605 [Pseudomonadota bacterium]|nr:hypothetical protein [Pseudomonadota bacterium]
MPGISLIIVRLGCMLSAPVISEDEVTAPPFMAMNDSGVGPHERMNDAWQAVLLDFVQREVILCLVIAMFGF